MNDNSKLPHAHGDHDHPKGGSCCGGGADDKVKALAVPGDKSAPAGDTKAKPAKSSGCCGG